MLDLRPANVALEVMFPIDQKWTEVDVLDTTGVEGGLVDVCRDHCEDV